MIDFVDDSLANGKAKTQLKVESDVHQHQAPEVAALMALIQAKDEQILSLQQEIERLNKKVEYWQENTRFNQRKLVEERQNNVDIISHFDKTLEAIEKGLPR